jgi:hypothetical protein
VIIEVLSVHSELVDLLIIENRAYGLMLFTNMVREHGHKFEINLYALPKVRG